MCKSILKHFLLLIPQLDVTVVYGWTYIWLSSLNAKSVIQMWSWLQTDVSLKSPRVSCYTVAWYYVQSLLKTSRSFYFIFYFFFLGNAGHCTALPSHWFTRRSGYSRKGLLTLSILWILKRKKKIRKKKAHLDYSHILCQFCVKALIPYTCIMSSSDNKCKKWLQRVKTTLMCNGPQHFLLVAIWSGCKIEWFGALKFIRLWPFRRHQ